MTQGDPLSMFAYAMATVPMIERIGRPNEGRDVWYADDASACAPLCDLKDWFSELIDVGPSFGYHPEPKKCVLVVSPDHLTTACAMFNRFGVEVTTGHGLLGSFIGDHPGMNNYVEDCVREWLCMIEKLIIVAKTQPQLAYSAFMRSIQCQWTYLQRVTPHSGSFFEPIDCIVTEQLLPTIFGCEISSLERILFSLPTRMGGLNILNPVETAFSNYNISRKLTSPITDALKGIINFDVEEFNFQCNKVQEEAINTRDLALQKMFNETISQLNDMQQRAVMRAKDEKMSSWLNVIPVAKHHFDLSAQEFRDALAIRYKKPLLGVPSHCDGCGAPFNLSHALSCRKGGLVTQRHNEVRDAFDDLASIA